MPEISARYGAQHADTERSRTEHEKPVCAAPVGQRGSYKPTVNSSAAQLVSEGTVECAGQ